MPKSWLSARSRAPISVRGVALWTLLSRGLHPTPPPPEATSDDEGGFAANVHWTRDVLGSSEATRSPRQHLVTTPFDSPNPLADGVSNPNHEQNGISQLSAAEQGASEREEEAEAKAGPPATLLEVNFCPVCAEEAAVMPVVPAVREASQLTPRSARGTTSDRRRPPSSVLTKTRPETARPSNPSRDTNKMDSLRSEESPPDSPVGLGSASMGREAGYRRRLDAYRRAHHDQAALVARLQAKVLQYKQRCSDLETHMLDSGPSTDSYRGHSGLNPSQPIIGLPPPSGINSASSAANPQSSSTMHSSALEQAQQHLREAREERIHDLETALRRLDEEKRKCEKFMQINSSLRDQLEESHQINEALTNDLQKLTNDWETLREEMIIKEDEWKDEEQAFNDYYTTEHNRLLSLWRDVVSVKRLFTEMQSATDRDLTKIKNEMESTCRDLTSVSNTMTASASTNALTDFELTDLKAKVAEYERRREQDQAEIQQRDAKMQQLVAELRTLEDRNSRAESALGELNALRNESGALRGALAAVARAVLRDSERAAIPAPPPHLHLSHAPPPSPPPPPSSHRSIDNRGITGTALAESTVSAVQAALRRHQTHIHELQVKLQGNREQLIATRKQCDAADANVANLERKVQELQINLDQAKGQINKMNQEKDVMQKILDTLKVDKSNLEKNRMEINAMFEALTLDYEKLQKSSTKMQKQIESLESEKRMSQDEIDRLQREATNRESILRSEEDRCSRIRQELLNIREELNKCYLSRDLLEQNKMEADSLISQMEKNRSDLEIELERSALDRADLQDSLEKMDNAVQTLEQEKKQLQEDLKKLEDEKSAMQNQNSDVQGDLNSLRKEILAAEQTRLDLEADKNSYAERIKFLESEKEKVELELAQVCRERSDLSSQLCALGRKKDSLAEEIMRLQQRLEQATETNNRLNRTLEELVKECEEKQVMLDGNDKEIQHLQEQLASLRSEKEALEGILFDTSTNLETVESKRQKLDKELQKTLLSEENLKGHVNRLTKDLEAADKKFRDTKNSLIQQASKKEAEYQQTITNLNKTNSENIRKLTEEREQIKLSLEKRMQQAIQNLGGEKDAEIAELQEREQQLQAAIDTLCQQHEEALLRAENDKQQVLLIAHHDQQALLERLEETKRALDNELNSLERTRREAQARCEQDRNAINQLKDEITNMKSRLEEAKNKAEDDLLRSETRIQEILTEKDNCMKEYQDTRLQLQMAEDKAENLSTQLNDTLRKLKEIENESENLRKELTDTRRQLSNSNVERDKYNSTNKELRDQVKRSEQERREHARSLEEAFHKIAGLEEQRNALDAERTRLTAAAGEAGRQKAALARQAAATRDQLQRAQGGLATKQHEEKELHARLQNESEERERIQQELAQMKRQASELENHLVTARQEIGRLRARGAELEERCHTREQELLLRLEDSRGKERRLEDLKHNLEVCLADATQQIQELKARLGGTEGRVRALESQTVNAESNRRNAEQKLGAVGAALRRIAGIPLDASGAVTSGARLTSPTRRWSPHRGQDHERDRSVEVILDVDPDVVRKGIRNLMQQVAQIERERDELKSQACGLRKQLKEVNDYKTKGDVDLSASVNNVKSLEEKKAQLQTSLAQKQIQLQTQTEALQQKSEEASSLKDKITSLELTLNSGNEEKGQIEERAEKLRNSLSRCEAERRALAEEAGRAEQRAARAELQRAALEGDTRRLQLAKQEKEAQMQKMQEHCENQSRTILTLEERCTSLKATVDQLSASLQKAATSESELRSELNRLQRQLTEAKNHEHITMEKLKQLQKSLSNCDSEKRILHEKIDVIKNSLAEVKRDKQQLQDQVHRLNNQLANVEVQRSTLESQLRLSNWDGKEVDSEVERELHATQRDKSELRAKVEALHDKIRQLEAEKRAAKTTRSKTLHSLGADVSDPLISMYEQENRELKIKIRRLENQLAEKEAELSIARSKCMEGGNIRGGNASRDEIDRLRASALQSERLLESRESSYRQQIMRLESQIQALRNQLSQEARRRQLFVLRSGRAGRDMQRLRTALGDSLRTVSQEPALDSLLLEHEARKLDNTLAHSLPHFSDDYESSK
ncbi:ciliary rootlet coiled-coil, rootletin [Arctopsyche grandis]|uniref:ciliary rootlet coiled-coil, rootletin n=1 Tax=Arctopsyche grandis TaxID=121162 RepID=UPI00406DA416